MEYIRAILRASLASSRLDITPLTRNMQCSQKCKEILPGVLIVAARTGVLNTQIPTTVLSDPVHDNYQIRSQWEQFPDLCC
jgi:hypothetical protein